MDALTIFGVIFSVYALYTGLQFSLATKAPIIVIVGGSMRPTLKHGDLVVIKGVPATSIHREDIIAYRPGKGYNQGNTTIWPFTIYTVHRVVKIRSLANGTILFSTKGDNNKIIDARPVPDPHVQGRVIHRIPYLGHLFQDPAITFTITTIVAIIILIWPEKKTGFHRHKRIRKTKLKIVSSLFLISSLIAISTTGFTPYMASASFTGEEDLVNGVNSGIIHVPDDSPSIQKAINAANDGDIVSVEAGKYYERVTVNKSVTLLGKEGAIIDGNGTGNIVSITQDYVEISGFTIQNGYRGIWLSHSLGSTIRSNELKLHIGAAIELHDSNKTIISGNNILNTNHAIYLLYSSCGNIISDNNVTNNSQGLALSWHCNGNTITSNTVTSNSFAGIVVGGSNNNTIYHNNFINNPEHVYSYNSTNAWNNGAEGNYWSDYNGKDKNSDGIGDTRLPHKGFDYYPLMEPWSMTRVFDIPWSGETYPVTTLCNSTVASFNFNDTLKQISFNITGPTGTVGFCNVTIPKKILLADRPEDWLTEVDGTRTNSTIVENANHTSLSFMYTREPRELTHMIKITGTSVILDTIPPVANAGPNQTILEDEPTSFDASASVDNIRIARYEWDFGDGTNGTGTTTTHIYPEPGTYDVKLTVRDRAGNNASNIATITVLRDTDGDWTPDVTDMDDDNDGVPDVWEAEKGLNPLIIDAYFDPDNDGLNNLEEYLRGTNPFKTDSDGDLWTDSIDLMPKDALIPNTLIIATAIIISALFMMRKIKGP